MTPTQDLINEAGYSPTRDPQTDEAGSPRMVPCDVIKNELLCAICLGILKKTVTSQECLHRFCHECIRTSLQISNQECPTCRAKLTESNLRADPVFDNLIEKLFPPSTSYQLDKKGFSIETFESPETSLHSKSSEAVANFDYLKTNPHEVSKTSNAVKECQNILDDVYKVTHSDIKSFNTGENGKGKKSSSKNYATTKEGATAKNCIVTGTEDLNIEQPQEGESKTVTKEVTQNSLSLNKKLARKLNRTLRKSSTPKRRSLRIEAIHLESDKNKSEIDYNLRLSNGTADVFFSSLQLKRNILKTVAYSRCENKIKLDSIENENIVSQEDINIPKISIQQDRELMETLDLSDTTTQKETFLSNKGLTVNKSIVFPKEESSLADINHFDEQIQKLIEENDETLEEGKCKFVSDENANVSDNMNLTPKGSMDMESNPNHIRSRKRGKQTELAVSRPRSQRFAAFMAHENILMQTASRRRLNRPM